MALLRFVGGPWDGTDRDMPPDSETVWTRLLKGCVHDYADAIGEPAATVVLRHQPGHHGVSVCAVAPQAVRSACATPTTRRSPRRLRLEARPSRRRRPRTPRR